MGLQVYNPEDMLKTDVKYTQKEAGFIDGGYKLGADVSKSCGNCQFYDNAGMCFVVEGAITPDDVCTQFFTPVRSEGHMGLNDIDQIQKSFFITRVSKDEQTGVLRWFAKASGTDLDSYEERMSRELFQDFIRRIKSGEKVPVAFRSDFWNGGLPYLSIAHYLDLGGDGVGGMAEKVWIDGDVFKAKGIFSDTPMGNAIFEATQADIENNLPDDLRVRISIAFIDHGHVHESVGQELFTTKCEHCKAGVLGKIYMKGQLIHLAATRIPAYTDTSLEAVLRSGSGKTFDLKKLDAASIVGKDLAELLAEKEIDLVGRANLVTKNYKEEDKMAKDKEEHPPVEDEDEDEDDMKKKNKKKKNEHPPVEEAVADEVEEEVVAEDEDEEDESELAAMSLGGAQNFEDAEAFLAKSKTEMPIHAVLSVVLNNATGGGNAVQISEAVGDYTQRFDNLSYEALNDVKEMLEARSAGDGNGGAPQNAMIAEDHPLAAEMRSFAEAFDLMQKSDLPDEDKLYAFQEQYNGFYESLGVTIRTAVMGEQNVAVSAETADLTKRIGELEGLIAGFVAAQAGAAQKPPESAVPTRRSLAAHNAAAPAYPAPVVAKAVTQHPGVKPMSALTRSIRASVDPRLVGG